MSLVAMAVLGGVTFVGCTPNVAPPTPTQAPGSAVSAPSGGNVTETVRASSTPKVIAADLTAPAEPTDGLTVQITKVQAIEAKAQGPGEVAGPAVAVTISLANDAAAPFDVSLLSVNLEDSKGLPGAGMIAAPASWIKKAVPAGGTATGVYVFGVPKRNRDPIKVMVSVNPGVPTVAFSGKA